MQLIRFGALIGVSYGVARLSSSPAEAKVWEAWYLAVSSFSFFWIMGALDGLVPVFESATEKEKPQLVALVFRWGLLLSCLVALPVALLTPVGELPQEVRIAFGLLALLHFPVYFFIYREFLLGRPRALMEIGILWFSLYAVCVLIPLGCGATLHLSLWLLVGAHALFAVGIALSQPASVPAGRKALLNRWTRVAIPLGLSALVGGLAFYFNGNLARIRLPNEGFLQYSYGARELPLVLLLANSLSSVYAGRLAALLRQGGVADGLKQLRAESARWSLILFPLHAGLLLGSEPLFRWALGDTYAEGYRVFDWYLLLIIPRLFFPQAVLRAHQDSKPLLMSAAIEFVICAGLALLLMPHWGMVGLAASAIIAFCCEKIINAFVAFRRYGISWRGYTSPVWLLCSAALIALFAVKCVWL